MSIDWITASAQIINFLILVWLLKRFLYKPVLSAMDEREQRVTQRLRDADQREQEAEQQRQQFHQQQAQLELYKEQALKEARVQAEKLKHELLNEARDEVAKNSSAWQKQAEQERGVFIETLQKHTKNSVLTIARNALKDLAGVNLEPHLINTFINKLNDLNEADHKRFESAEGPLELRTSFTLNETHKEQLRQAIIDRFTNCSQLVFKESSDFGFGLQLNAQEQRIDWNFESYLTDLDREFDKALTAGGAV